MRLDDKIDVDAKQGLRCHPTRGSMSIGPSNGGLPPDAPVAREGAILRDSVRVIDVFDEAVPGAMCRLGSAPC